MKLSQFKNMLRELIREEVRGVVKQELRVLSEQKVLQKQPPKQINKPQRTTPLVTLDEPFGMASDTPFGQLLQETAANMAGFGEEVEETNPDFPMGSTGTNAFVKDYSEVLKKSQGIR
jgi:hypothetical protein